MKYIRLLVFALFFAPFGVNAAAPSEFTVAAQLLAAARNADIAQVEVLINNGANVNFVDATGLSIVCTALMNNDVRAAQILQTYGADASKCDQQIKKYNSRTTKENSGGLFSGLSSAHTITLAAAGAAVVVGGLFLLTDVFDPGNDNHSGSANGGNRPGGDGGNTGGNGGTVAMTMPYGPAMPNATSEQNLYTDNLNYYSPSTAGILKDNFNLMTNGDIQNYLLMMHGYSPLARGYLGQRTLRNETSREPFALKNAAGQYLYTLDGQNVQGGRPVNVAMVTANGVNAATNTSLGEWDETLGRWDVMLYSQVNGNTVNPASKDMIFSKFYNNKVTSGETLGASTIEENPDTLSFFDLAGMGTAIHNIGATFDDNILAKVVGGKSGGYAAADYMGFMPNGQMAIYRTGGGTGMKAVTGTPQTGTYTMAGTNFANGDKITLFGKTMTVTVTSVAGDGLLTFTATEDLPDGSTDTPAKYAGYIGVDGQMYIDGAADGKINQVYKIADGTLTQTMELGDVDYRNYEALRNASALWAAEDVSGGRSRPDILANASIVPALRLGGTETMDYLLSLDEKMQSAGFISLVNKYYDRDTADGKLPGTDAQAFFNGLGSSYLPLVIFSTGAFETNSTYSGNSLEATFENAAPIIFDNLEHLFMSVVAVGLTGSGTSDTKSVSGYNPGGKIALAQWSVATGQDTTDYYKSRICGVGGTGVDGVIDPWCFAAAGQTDQMAVASAAGAAGAVKSAFAYLNNKQVFALLALTADGPYLATDSAGRALSKEDLKAYLQSMYDLPTEYQWKVDNKELDYLDAFKKVFGYGLINLERATKPNSKIYYYNGNDIVSSAGNAYWRAATNTVFRSSAAFSPRAASISAPFFDILESVDGQLRLPRVWENEFALSSGGRRGLYMGDVLGGLKTREDVPARTNVGVLGISMKLADMAYDDGLGNLDAMEFDYASGAWNFRAGYQRYLTDGMSRFDGAANPILSMASNAVSSGAQYNAGAWTFGGRAFSGAITDEGLLENDPTVTAQYRPARLGLISGASADIGWHGDLFGMTASFGTAHESDTVLGAQTGGLLSLGQGDTTYVDVMGQYNVMPDVALRARATFARTTAAAAGEFILGLTDIESDAFAVGILAGDFEFTVARPLGVRSGRMQYAHADYDVIEGADGKYDLEISNTHVADLDLSPRHRELRFSGMYRHNLGEFTDGAVGFIYRVNPNHVTQYGNETILMMKMTHRLGI